MEKRCVKCNTIKLLTQYHKNKNTKDGYHTICKICNNKQASIWAKNNYEKVIFMKKERRKDVRYSLVESAKTRSLKKNLTFDISVNDIIIPEYCPALNIKLIKSSNRLSSNSPSIDRIDSNKGYTKDNIQILSFKANAMKNNASKEELITFAKWILKHENIDN